MEMINFIWGIIEPLIFCFAILIFFKDSIRRWNFFGYRPTAVMGLFDPKMNKVLLAKVSNAWAFNQGAIYDNNIYYMCKDILDRELGLPNTRFKVIYTKPLGTVKISNEHLLNRARISTVSLFRRLRGKGYLACFIRIDLSGIEKEIKLGAGIQDFRIVDFEQAKTLIKEPAKNTYEHSFKKQEMLLAMIDEIQAWSIKLNDWEEESQPNIGKTKQIKHQVKKKKVVKESTKNRK